jgi:hypothetical protein
MDTFRTLFRLAVMLVALYLGYLGWQRFGPPAERLKSIGERAWEIARSAVGEEAPAAEGTPSLASDPPAAAPPFASQAPATPGPIQQAQSLVPAQAIVPGPAPASFAPPELMAAPVPTAPAAHPSEPASPIELSPEAGLAALYARLDQLGVHEHGLQEWGGSGQLYRFSCQAAVDDSPDFSRQFESIAANPRAAVEEVLEKVAAWRESQRNEAQVGAVLSY